ncbi:nuclear transport factor 2 family protein [Actinomadura craniellae]|uniref:Nuclear transport factor 2 family protein n=1 Tax=Actinomadura craniellae TaxID=2231787 RepID=A0A365HDD5_9ACTN|nr:nuclear transport factor 2 family protein [Actinomadura craniellae]RAY17140.1 nuclear transport factor 2 family protein [Actinomadura craniellae]
MDLIALEEIRRAKYRYLRCVDLKLWDDFGDTFTEDAVARYDTPVLGKSLNLAGRDAIVDYMRANLGPGTITTHLVGQHDIEIDGDRAIGHWSLEDTVIVMKHRLMIRGAAYYEDHYRRCPDGRWRISRTGHERTYEFTVSLDDLPSLAFTANRWAPADPS